MVDYISFTASMVDISERIIKYKHHIAGVL